MPSVTINLNYYNFLEWVPELFWLITQNLAYQNIVYASACAGSLILGVVNRSCTPSKICLIVIAGLQSLSSSSIDKHIVPDGYTFGWNRGGSNLPKTFKMNVLIETTKKILLLQNY